MVTEKAMIITIEIMPNGSMSFSVRVRRRLPDFLHSVNLKYVKLGYHYLISHGFYLFTIPVLLVALSAQIGTLSKQELWIQLWNNLEVSLFGIEAFPGGTKKRRMFDLNEAKSYGGLGILLYPSLLFSTLLPVPPLSFFASSDPCF